MAEIKSANSMVIQIENQSAKEASHWLAVQLAVEFTSSDLQFCILINTPEDSEKSFTK